MTGNGAGSRQGGADYFDSHCHLTPKLPGGVEVALATARAAGVGGFITVGCDRASSEEAIDIAWQHSDVYATVGLHPHDAIDGVASIADLFDGAPDDRRRRIVAVGECGLDYYYDHSPRDTQRQVFAEQIQLAWQLGLALVIHTRDAWDDTFDIIAAEGAPPRTIFHCFTGGAAEARRCLDLGAFLSFSGIVTFKSALDVQQAARLCPIDRLLVETDSPYLAPVPLRGRPNQPAHVKIVSDHLAELRGEDAEAVAAATKSNAHVAFCLAIS
jgi:TatD DNase family protein